MAHSMTRGRRRRREGGLQGAAAPNGAGARGVAAGQAELPETLGRMLSRPLAFTGTETQVLTCWARPLTFTETQAEV